MKPQDTLKHILDTTIDLTYVLHYLLTTSIHLLFSLPCHAHLLAPLFTCHAATPIHLLLSLPCHAHLLAPLFTCHAHSPTPFTPMPRPPTCSIIYLPRPFTYSFTPMPRPLTCPLIYLPRPFTYSFHSHATPTYLPPYLLATPIHLLLSLPCHAHLPNHLLATPTYLEHLTYTFYIYAFVYMRIRST